MNTYVVRVDAGCEWKARPGCRILVKDGGAVRFDFPRDWIACADSQCVRIIDREPPFDTCGLIVATRLMSHRMAAFSIGDLLKEITAPEVRRTLHRGPIIRILRPPLEAAWIEIHYHDPILGREAVTRVCLARGGCTLATLVFDFSPEHELDLHAAWTTLLETLTVGDYIEDPVTGRKREQRG